VRVKNGRFKGSNVQGFNGIRTRARSKRFKPFNRVAPFRTLGRNRRFNNSNGQWFGLAHHERILFDRHPELWRRALRSRRLKT
jgi:hypothetical protein